MALAGKGGSVQLAANTIAEVEQWKLDISAEMVDTTNMSSSGWKTFIAGLNEWSGSFDCNYAVSTDTNGQLAVQNAILAGTTLSPTFNLGNSHNYSGTILVKKVSIDTSVKDKIKLTVDFQGSGAPTYA